MPDYLLPDGPAAIAHAPADREKNIKNAMAASHMPGQTTLHPTGGKVS